MQTFFRNARFLSKGTAPSRPVKAEMGLPMFCLRSFGDAKAVQLTC